MTALVTTGINVRLEAGEYRFIFTTEDDLAGVRKSFTKADELGGFHATEFKRVAPGFIPNMGQIYDIRRRGDWQALARGEVVWEATGSINHAIDIPLKWTGSQLISIDRIGDAKPTLLEKAGAAISDTAQAAIDTIVKPAKSAIGVLVFGGVIAAGLFLVLKARK